MAHRLERLTCILSVCERFQASQGQETHPVFMTCAHVISVRVALKGIMGIGHS